MLLNMLKTCFTNKRDKLGEGVYGMDMSILSSTAIRVDFEKGKAVVVRLEGNEVIVESADIDKGQREKGTIKIREDVK